MQMNSSPFHKKTKVKNISEQTPVLALIDILRAEVRGAGTWYLPELRKFDVTKI